MKNVQILTLEINNVCNLTELHPKCPVGDPERYKFGDTSQVMSDEFIIEFWKWCYDQGFRGIVVWHLYNEPTLALSRIYFLMGLIHEITPEQKFHLWTNNVRKFPTFDHVQLTDYRTVRPTDLDNRLASAHRDTRGYNFANQQGHCTRGYGWELIIDHHGNWLLCCSDFRCENAIGNVFKEDWAELFEKYKQKAVIEWQDKESFDALPRMCKACITENPNLHRSATLVGYGG